MPTFTSAASTAFPGADENPLSEGGAWTTDSGVDAMRIVSNHAQSSATLGNDSGSHYTGVTFDNNQYSRGKLTVTGTAAAGSGVGLEVRGATGARTLFRFVIDHAASNNARLSRFVAGANTTLVTWTQAFTDGDQFTFAIEGSVLYVYDKTLAQVQTFDDTGGGGPASGSPGILYSSTETSAGQVDDWEGGTFSTAAAGGGTLLSIPLTFIIIGGT